MKKHESNPVIVAGWPWEMLNAASESLQVFSILIWDGRLWP